MGHQEVLKLGENFLSVLGKVKTKGQTFAIEEFAKQQLKDLPQQIDEKDSTGKFQIISSDDESDVMPPATKVRKIETRKPKFSHFPKSIPLAPRFNL